MSSQTKIRKIALLAEIKKLIASKVPAAQLDLTNLFVAHYCNEVDAEDFLACSASDWATLSMSHLGFGNEFQRGAPKMRSSNSKQCENGWEATGTVIELVNDDMLFLVDSIAMEINRQGIAIQLLLHPLFAATRDQHGVLFKLDDARCRRRRGQRSR